MSEKQIEVVDTAPAPARTAPSALTASASASAAATGVALPQNASAPLATLVNINTAKSKDPDALAHPAEGVVSEAAAPRRVQPAQPTPEATNTAPSPGCEASSGSPPKKQRVGRLPVRINANNKVVLERAEMLQSLLQQASSAPGQDVQASLARCAASMDGLFSVLADQMEDVSSMASELHQVYNERDQEAQRTLGEFMKLVSACGNEDHAAHLKRNISASDDKALSEMTATTLLCAMRPSVEQMMWQVSALSSGDSPADVHRRATSTAHHLPEPEEEESSAPGAPRGMKRAREIANPIPVTPLIAAKQSVAALSSASLDSTRAAPVKVAASAHSSPFLCKMQEVVANEANNMTYGTYSKMAISNTKRGSAPATT